MVTSLDKKKILIVDDEPHVRELIKNILTPQGYEIQTAGNGQKALQKLKREQYHLVILDLKMPDMDGVEVLQKLKLIDPFVSVLLITAYGTIDSATEALKGGAYDYITKTFEDIDEFKQKVAEGVYKEEEARKAAEKKFQQEKLAALGEAAARVVHEIKNPLAVISGFVQLFPVKYHDDHFRKKFTEMLTLQTARLNDIAEELLLFARPKKIKRESIILSQLIDKAIGSCQSAILSKEVVMTKTSNEKRINLTGDENSLIQVFVNLIQNAIDALPAKKGELKINSQKNGKFATIRVQDNGSGIPKDKIGSIFEPFQTTKSKGTGLGLAITQNIIEAHGGEITVESQVNQGSCFHIRLPLTKEKESEA